jgi:hypothetical protein
MRDYYMVVERIVKREGNVIHVDFDGYSKKL